MLHHKHGIQTAETEHSNYKNMTKHHRLLPTNISELLFNSKNIFNHELVELISKSKDPNYSSLSTKNQQSKNLRSFQASCTSKKYTAVSSSHAVQHGATTN